MIMASGGQDHKSSREIRGQGGPPPCKIDDQLPERTTAVSMVGKMEPDNSGINSTSRQLCRLSLELSGSEKYGHTWDSKSLSDSELDKPSSNMTSEYLNLPRRLSERSTSPLLYRLDPEKMCLDLKSSFKSTHSNIGARDCSGINPPKIQLSNIEVIVDNIEDDIDQTEDMYLDSLGNVDRDDYMSRGSGVWINLEPKNHALLSPRSSNGSICSFRSSNADSAIDMLTPDEELPDHSIAEGASSTEDKLWDSQPGSRISDHNLNLGSSVSHGAIKDCDTYDAIPYSSTPTTTSSSSKHCSDSLLFPAINSSPLLPVMGQSAIMTQHSMSCDFLSPSWESTQGDQTFTKDNITQGEITFLLDNTLESTQQEHEQQVCSTPYSAQGEISFTGTMSSQGRPLHSTPSVIISDFSSKHSSEDKGSQTSESSGPGAEGEGHQDQLLSDRYSYQRSFSNSSISSESSLSIFSDTSASDVADMSDFPIKIKRKQSSWKKLRSIVHWSPFIQQFKRRKYPWIQLAGHQGNFQAGEPGAILKKYDKREHTAFNKLMSDVLRPYVPEYRGEVEKNGDCYLQLQDLLCEFEAPCVMDMKMGCRTYLEEELTKAREKPTLRKDMYQKMIEVDPNAPTAEEHEQGAIIKPRYMQWRDEISSSVEMGFRIEGIRKSNGDQVKNFKKTKERSSVKKCLRQFVEENPAIILKYLRRLKAIKATQESSPFFKRHEIIGSSLLFVHDKCNQASIWMIDFGKTNPLPSSISVSHKDKWVEGNHEDGYLMGVENLIQIFEELHNEVQTTEESINSKDSESSSVEHCSTHQNESSDSSKDLKQVEITDKVKCPEDTGISSTENSSTV